MQTFAKKIFSHVIIEMFFLRPDKVSVLVLIVSSSFELVVKVFRWADIKLLPNSQELNENIDF